MDFFFPTIPSHGREYYCPLRKPHQLISLEALEDGTSNKRESWSRAMAVAPAKLRMMMPRLLGNDTSSGEEKPSDGSHRSP
jgi:hypothetical protein